MRLHELSISAMTLAQLSWHSAIQVCPNNTKTKASSHCEWTGRGPLDVTQPSHTQTHQKQNKKTDRLEQLWYGPWPLNRHMALVHICAYQLVPTDMICVRTDLFPKPFAVHEMNGNVENVGTSETRLL
jgi:hypothetical protein